MKKLTAALAGTVLLASAPAHATAFGVTSVVMTIAVGNYIQVGELQAISTGAVNVALASNGGVATAKSQYNGITGPDVAINGNTYGFFGGTTGQGIYASQTTDASEYLKVRFAAPANLQTLNIFGRVDCCANRDVYNVALYAGNTLL